MIRTLLLSTFLFVSLCAYAQKGATTLYDRHGYKASLEANKKTLNKDRDDKGNPKDVPIQQAVQIAESYRLTGDYASAVQWYGSVVTRSDNPKYKLLYGQCLQAIGDCSAARQYFLEYDQLMLADSTAEPDKIDRRGRDFAESCANGVRALDNVSISLAPFSSNKMDFSPMQTGKGVVFVSNRSNPKKAFRKRKDIWMNDDFLDLWIAAYDDSGGYLEPEPFSSKLNSKLHEGPMTFNGGKDVIYFTRNLIVNGKRKKDKKGATRLGIYTAQLVNGVWTNIQAFPYNSETRIYCHPALSPDGQYLYFSSDRPGGYGGLDIWVSKFGNGRWGKPENLGPAVNTAGNDNFPFVHSDGTLYYASNGRGGVGGVDVFYSQPTLFGDSISWNAAQNLGKPFNSTYDDFGFIANDSYTTGFFSSNRSGGKGADDIYKFKTAEGLKPTPPPVVVEANIYVYDNLSSAHIAGATVTVTEEGDNGLGKGEMMVTLKPVEGQANMFYLSTSPAKGNGAEANPMLVSDENGNIHFNMEPGHKYKFVAKKEGYDKAFSEFSTEGITTSQKVEHGIPMMRPKKADCFTVNAVVVNAAYNNAPIPNAKVTVINRCNGEKSELTTDDKGKVEMCVNCKCDYDVTAQKERFLPAVKPILATKDCPKTGSNMELALTYSEVTVGELKTGVPEYTTNVIKEGAVVELPDVFYDYNKADVRDDARNILDKLAALMNKYLEMEVEIGSHTDSRGSKTYNRNLSQKRAQSVVDYMVSKGVAKERLKAAGYGEDQPRNICLDGTECSEEDYQYNRRTEFKVTKFPYNDVKVRYPKNNPEKVDRKPAAPAPAPAKAPVAPPQKVEAKPLKK